MTSEAVLTSRIKSAKTAALQCFVLHLQFGKTPASVYNVKKLYNDKLLTEHSVLNHNVIETRQHEYVQSLRAMAIRKQATLKVSRNSDFCQY